MEMRFISQMLPGEIPAKKEGAIAGLMHAKQAF